MLAVAFALAAALVQSAPAQGGGATGGIATPAAPQATASETAAEPAAPVRERLICTSEQITGTRFPIRRCRTAAQIAADRVESQEMLRRQQGARIPPQG